VTAIDVPSEESGVGPPRWVAASLDVKEGRDPLGFQTTTIDRLMPRLLPGILENSDRARYFSFHAFLLDLYRAQRRPANSGALSDYIRAREWEYGLAVMVCPHECGSSPVGAIKLRSVVRRQDPPYPRGESVETAFGGFGLYYRSPMAVMGVVARAGTMLGDAPIAIDLLRDNDRARHLAQTFREAIADTAYFNTWMHRSDPLPLDVLVEYANVACLCQLNQHEDERAAVYDAMFESDLDSDAAEREESEEAEGLPGGLDYLADGDVTPLAVPVVQRRRSVAHYLTLVDTTPAIVESASTFRDALWSPRVRSDEHAIVAGQWAGLIAKDIWQEALCSIWSEFCRTGLAATWGHDGEGLSWDETQALARSLVTGPPTLDPDATTRGLIDSISSGLVSIGNVVVGDIDATSLEMLRTSTVAADTAASGLVVLLELHRRAHQREDAGWLQATAMRSVWQPSVADAFLAITQHLDCDPTVGDTLWWLVHSFVLSVHERIAYSKLPEHTFRFRWEDGRVRFYDNGIGRFRLAATRSETLATLTWDLGFWKRGESASLTPLGTAFINEVFP